MQGQTRKKEPTVIDVANSVFAGLELAQKRGAYSFEESAQLYQSITLMKQYFKQVIEQIEKEQTQLATIEEV